MKTDSLFYRLFQEWLETPVAGGDSENAGLSEAEVRGLREEKN